MELLKAAQEIKLKLDKLEYVRSLRWEFETIQEVYALSIQKNIDIETWLPGVYAWLVLDFAMKYKDSTPQKNCNTTVVKKLAHLLGIPDKDWDVDIQKKS